MNREQLENLIETALLDGNLDVSERYDLSRFAAECNVSEATLQQLINERHRAHVQSGVICAKCGKPVENALSTKCLCKASLANQRRSLALEELNRQITAAASQDERLLAIKSFPLPTAQNDVVAILSCASSAQTAEHDARHSAVGLSGVLTTLGIKDEDPTAVVIRQEAAAWKTKAIAILENSKILYAGDDEFLRVLQGFQEKYEVQTAEQKREKQVRLIMLVPITLFTLLISNPRISLSIPGLGKVLYPLFTDLQPVLLVLMAGLLLVVAFGLVRKRSRNVVIGLSPSTFQGKPTLGAESSTIANVPTGRQVAGAVPNPIPPPSFQNISAQVPAHETSPKSRGVAIVLCLLLGFYGAHRFYAGKYGTGVLMMFTAGGLFLWWMVDLFALITSSFTDSKGRVLV